MIGVEQLFGYRFPNESWPIAKVRDNISEIADRFCLTVEAWNEDGLGEVLGIVLKLPSKRVFMLIDYKAYNEAHGLAHSPLELFFDVGDVAALGVRPLLNEALDFLNLSGDALVWVAPEASRDDAANLLRHAENLHSRR
ncbi:MULTISPECIES: hypothetical protein [unclassified Bradyrhizobium]|uniref:hypothetical protein n=1 Tax=unclassified Bradyrhizobium TaxID=2631580 RepID=UPI00291702EB|nr:MULTISPECIES: hypothetical protein [unclassified Bradyrhizobium]